MRSFTSASLLDGSGLSLALAPGLTPAGLSESPEFFSGFAVAPTVLARGLLVLADVARTRYFQPVPAGGGGSDPICTANGDRLRFEAFSACNTVAVRLDLLAGAFDGGDIRHGTTNVDINQPLREALGGVSPAELMHLSVGDGGLRVSTPEATHVERRVELPERWLRALGPAQELSRDLTLIGQTPAVQTRQLLASLASAPGGLGHWSISRRGGCAPPCAREEALSTPRTWVACAQPGAWGSRSRDCGSTAPGTAPKQPRCGSSPCRTVGSPSR